MRDEEMRRLERACAVAPNDLATLRRFADARKRAGDELLPAVIHDDGWRWFWQQRRMHHLRAAARFGYGLALPYEWVTIS